MESVREVVVVFTTLLTGLDASSNRCYVCTTIDANAMLKEIADPNWLRWLENVRYAPYSEHCADDFKVDLALRGGVKNYECNQGACMKMVIQQKTGASYVWRSCLSQTKKEIRQDCTRVSSSEVRLSLRSVLQKSTEIEAAFSKGIGNLEVCTCNGNLCNSAYKYAVISSLSVFLLCRLFDNGF